MKIADLIKSLQEKQAKFADAELMVLVATRATGNELVVMDINADDAKAINKVTKMFK